ncbi:MAG: M50 family metallopeptidase [Bacteroidales bacterium]|nr:M50 family metallopeptidase [Bacteroidales bacterium]
MIIRHLWQNPDFVFYFILCITLIVIHLPIIGRYIRIIETMIHELGHVLTAIFFGCKINKINLLSNSSGETHIQGGSSWKTVFIALAGYPFASAVAYAGFWLLKNNFSYLFVIILCTVALFCLILYIRNGFGILWTLLLIAANVTLLYFYKSTIFHILGSIYASILFISAISSAFTLFFLSFKGKGNAGDASVIAKIIHIPQQIIAFLILIISALIAWKTMEDFFPHFPQFNFL